MNTIHPFITPPPLPPFIDRSSFSGDGAPGQLADLLSSPPLIFFRVFLSPSALWQIRALFQRHGGGADLSPSQLTCLLEELGLVAAARNAAAAAEDDDEDSGTVLGLGGDGLGRSPGEGPPPPGSKAPSKKGAEEEEDVEAYLASLHGALDDNGDGLISFEELKARGRVGQAAAGGTTSLEL